MYSTLSPPSIPRLRCPWARHRTPNCSPVSRRSVEKIGDLGSNAGKLLLFIKSKANRQKQTNNQQRDTPDGNVVLVSRVHKTECNWSDRKYSEHAYMHMWVRVEVISAGRGTGLRCINSPHIGNSWEWWVGAQVCGVKWWVGVQVCGVKWWLGAQVCGVKWWVGAQVCGVKWWIQEEGRWCPLAERGRTPGPGLLTLPPLKERLPDVPEPPTRGTAGRGLSRGRDGGARPCSGRDPPRKRQPGVPGRGTQSRRPGRGRGDRPGRI